MEKLVSIVIPFYNNIYDDLFHCLTSVKTFTDQPYELVLVDDGSEDEKASALGREHANVYIRHDETEGIAKTLHDGVSAATADYIFTLNSDCIVTPFWVPRMVKKFDKYQSDDFKIVILGAMVSCWLGIFLFRENIDKYETMGLIDCSEVGTACMLFHRSLIDKIGNFDPGLYNLWSDLDFCRRAKKINEPGVNPKICINPEVMVYHPGWIESKKSGWFSLEGRHTARGDSKFESPEWLKKRLQGLMVLNLRYGIGLSEIDHLKRRLADEGILIE